MLVYLFNNFNWGEYFFSPYMRCFMSFLASLIISLLCGKKLIVFLHKHQKKGQPIREDGPQSHLLTKKGTPTMGGILMLGASIFSFMLFCDLKNLFVWVGIVVLVIYGVVGFIDDYLKVTKQTANALSAKMKLLLQFSTALAAILVICYVTPEDTRFILNFPYTPGWNINLRWLYIPFAMIVIAGASNGVNLSDGLDGILIFFQKELIPFITKHSVKAAVSVTELVATIIVTFVASLLFLSDMTGGKKKKREN